jgi:hypothetical protein
MNRGRIAVPYLANALRFEAFFRGAPARHQLSWAHPPLLRETLRRRKKSTIKRSLPPWRRNARFK